MLSTTVKKFWKCPPLKINLWILITFTQPTPIQKFNYSYFKISFIQEGDTLSGSDANKQFRNSVFCSYFNDPERLLSLCNAILETDYHDVNKLNINTLEGIFFDSQKNDISCTVDDHFLVLVEHQSSVNENMPFRFLSYVAELLNKLVPDKQKIYRRALIKFPTPEFFVLYDGDSNEPLKRTMRLSDAFNGDSHFLELVATSFNINHGLQFQFAIDAHSDSGSFSQILHLHLFLLDYKTSTLFCKYFERQSCNFFLFLENFGHNRKVQ